MSPSSSLHYHAAWSKSLDDGHPTGVHENPPDLVEWLASDMKTYCVMPEIEAFDLSHILKANQMWQTGQIAAWPYVQFVMGVKNAMLADREDFNY